MRLPFPERVPLRYPIIFAALLCTAQLIQGTDPAFSLCCFLFIIVAAIAFNLAGGFTRPSGGYVFFFALLAVILSVFWKACLGEPADSNLLQPLLTIEAFLGGMIAMLGAVFVSRRLTRKRAILGNIDIEDMLQASIGCTIVGLTLTAVLTVVPRTSGSALSALAQLNGFLPLAMILGTIYEIRRSRGTRSINLPVLISGCAIFAQGLIGFSKQGIFTPAACWILAAASQRYRITVYQMIGFTLAGFFMVYYLVPYAQYGRNFRVYADSAADTGAPISGVGLFLANLDASTDLLFRLGYVRDQVEMEQTPERVEGVPEYFDTPQGLFDRLQKVATDDALINVTEDRGRLGMGPIIIAFENYVPHVLWPGKPHLNLGNFYAHEIGMIGAEDFSTGVTFSPIGEAFRLERWAGIFLLAPILWIMLFVLFDSLCGDIRKYPWGLPVLVIFSQIGPEGSLAGIIYAMWFTGLSVVFAALAAIYVMPILGYLATGAKGARLRRVPVVHSIPRRLPPIRPSENSGQ